jgi:hypothetical protein
VYDPYCSEVLPPDNRLLKVWQHKGDDGVNEMALLDDLQGCCAGHINLGPICRSQLDGGLIELAPVLGGCAEADEGLHCSGVCQDLNPEDLLPYRLEVYVQRRFGITLIEVVALVNLLDHIDAWVVYVPSMELCSDLCKLVSLLLLLLLVPLLLLLSGAFELLKRGALFRCQSCCRCDLSCGVQPLPIVADDRVVALLLTL